MTMMVGVGWAGVTSDSQSRGSRGSLMDRGVATACQTGVRSGWSFSQPRRGLEPTSPGYPAPIAGVPSGARRLPARRQRGSRSRTTLRSQRPTRHAEVLHLVSRCRHPRLDNLCLANSAEALAEQCLDRLDPRSVVGDGDLLPEPLPHSGQVQVAHVSRVVLVAASSNTRRIVSTSSAAVSASAGRTAEGELGELLFRSNGSDSTKTGRRSRGFRRFTWLPFETVSELSSAARAAWYAQTARITVAELGATEQRLRRSCPNCSSASPGACAWARLQVSPSYAAAQLSSSNAVCPRVATSSCSAARPSPMRGSPCARRTCSKLSWSRRRA